MRLRDLRPHGAVAVLFPPVAVLRQQADPPYQDRAVVASGGQDNGPATCQTLCAEVLAEDVDRLKRLNDLGVARVVPMFPPEKSDKVMPIIERWMKLMQQVNGCKRPDGAC